jgi:hypothetical protein
MAVRSILVPASPALDRRLQMETGIEFALTLGAHVRALVVREDAQRSLIP